MPAPETGKWSLDYFVHLMDKMYRYIKVFTSLIWPASRQTRDKQQDPHDCESQSDCDTEKSVGAFSSCVSVFNVDANSTTMDEVRLETEIFTKDDKLIPSPQCQNEDASVNLSTIVNFDESEMLARERIDAHSDTSGSTFDGDLDIDYLFTHECDPIANLSVVSIGDVNNGSDYSASGEGESDEEREELKRNSSLDFIPEWDCSQLSDVISETESEDACVSSYYQTIDHASPLDCSLSDGVMQVIGDAPSPPQAKTHACTKQSKKSKLNNSHQRQQISRTKSRKAPRQILEANCGDVKQGLVKLRCDQVKDVALKHKCTLTLETYNSLSGCKILNTNSGRFDVTYQEGVMPSDYDPRFHHSKACLTDKCKITETHFDLACLFGNSKQKFIYEPPKGVFELPSYRMDDQIVPQHGKRGKMSQFQMENRKVKRRGTPNLHLINKKERDFIASRMASEKSEACEEGVNPEAGRSQPKRIIANAELVGDSDRVGPPCARARTSERKGNPNHQDQRHYNVVPIEVILKKKDDEINDDDNKSRSKKKTRKKKQMKKTPTKENVECVEIRNMLLNNGAAFSDDDAGV